MQQSEIDRPLSALELQRFKSVIKASPEAMEYNEAIGFIVGICSAPTNIMPSTWAPVILGEIVYESAEDAQAIHGLVIRLCNQINISLIDGRQALPSTSLSDEELAGWCGGYLEAVGMDDVWTHDKASLSPLLPFGILSGEVPIAGITDGDGKVIEDDSEYRATARKTLPQWVAEIHKTWTQWRRNQMATPKPISPPKVQRNAPCPCGSGAKYKKCCGR